LVVVVVVVVVVEIGFHPRGFSQNRNPAGSGGGHSLDPNNSIKKSTMNK